MSTDRYERIKESWDAWREWVASLIKDLRASITNIERENSRQGERIAKLEAKVEGNIDWLRSIEQDVKDNNKSSSEHGAHIESRPPDESKPVTIWGAITQPLPLMAIFFIVIIAILVIAFFERSAADFGVPQ